MKRPYAYALILFAVAILGSLVWLHFQLVDRALAEAYELERETVGEVIGLAKERIVLMISEAERKLSDPSKERFRIIQPIIVTAAEGLGEIVSQYQFVGYDRQGVPLPKKEQRIHLKKLRNTISFELATVKQQYAELISGYGDQMDLNEEDIKKKKEWIGSIVKECTLTDNERFFNGNHFERRDMMMLQYIITLEKLVQDITSMMSGKLISCWFGPKQYPFITEQFENPVAGKKIETFIGIGTYDDELDARYLKVVVNGDTLQADSQYGLYYSFTPEKKGDQVLVMEMLYENPLTGLVSSRTHYYEYYVR